VAFALKKKRRTKKEQGGRKGNCDGEGTAEGLKFGFQKALEHSPGEKEVWGGKLG